MAHIEDQKVLHIKVLRKTKSVCVAAYVEGAKENRCESGLLKARLACINTFFMICWWGNSNTSCTYITQRSSVEYFILMLQNEISFGLLLWKRQKGQHYLKKCVRTHRPGLVSSHLSVYSNHLFMGRKSRRDEIFITWTSHSLLRRFMCCNSHPSITLGGNKTKCAVWLKLFSPNPIVGRFFAYVLCSVWNVCIQGNIYSSCCGFQGARMFRLFAFSSQKLGFAVRINCKPFYGILQKAWFKKSKHVF